MLAPRPQMTERTPTLGHTKHRQTSSAPPHWFRRSVVHTITHTLSHYSASTTHAHNNNDSVLGSCVQQTQAWIVRTCNKSAGSFSTHVTHTNSQRGGTDSARPFHPRPAPGQLGIAELQTIGGVTESRRHAHVVHVRVRRY